MHRLRTLGTGSVPGFRALHYPYKLMNDITNLYSGGKRKGGDESNDYEEDSERTGADRQIRGDDVVVGGPKGRTSPSTSVEFHVLRLFAVGKPNISRYTRLIGHCVLLILFEMYARSTESREELSGGMGIHA